MPDISKINLIQAIILSIFSFLIFILNVPGTIALRNILAALLLMILATLWAQAKISIKPLLSNKIFRSNLVVLLVITIFI